MNIREIEKKIDDKCTDLVILLAEINELEKERENYYKTQKNFCKKIVDILKGNEKHIPFID